MIAYKKVRVCFFSNTVAIRFLVLIRQFVFPLEFCVKSIFCGLIFAMQQRRKVDPVKQILARLDEKQRKVKHEKSYNYAL